MAVRLSDELGGNPLALVELAAILDVDQRRGAAPLPDPLPPTSPALVYAAAFAELPTQVQLAAATAAIAGNVPAWALVDALRRVGTDYDSLAQAEPTGLLRSTAHGVTWRHPLARSAAAAGGEPGGPSARARSRRGRAGGHGRNAGGGLAPSRCRDGTR
ncbi:MAG: hypothetical protein ACYDDU_11000 [Dermatophilaceae bacterium]